jgi:hypothetical protein
MRDVHLQSPIFQSFRLNGIEYLPIPFAPAEGNAPSLAHLGQAALVRR